MFYTIEGLQSDTMYDIQLSSHNGVSNQDLKNNDRRTVATRGGTTEGGQSSYDNYAQSLCSNYLKV